MNDYLPETIVINEIVAALSQAQRVAFFTGAGISADSGLPTYRGIGGLYNEMTVDEGLPIETVLSGTMFSRSPEITWKYIAEIERACRGAKLNAAHEGIAALDAHLDVCVITQNVDGFHKDAGSKNVIELHGNIREISCTSCSVSRQVSDYKNINLPPYCDSCQSIERPNVVLFGELLPEQSVQRFEQELRRGFDVLFAVGTSAGFPYIQQPIEMAAAEGVCTIEINPGVTPLSEIVRYRMACGAAEGMSEILAGLNFG